jgi:hypothetical protein
MRDIMLWCMWMSELLCQIDSLNANLGWHCWWRCWEWRRMVTTDSSLLDWRSASMLNVKVIANNHDNKILEEKICWSCLDQLEALFCSFVVVADLRLFGLYLLYQTQCHTLLSLKVHQCDSMMGWICCCSMRTAFRGRMQLKNSPISDVYLNGMNLLLLYENCF